jgi:hypothetical protein
MLVVVAAVVLATGLEEGESRTRLSSNGDQTTLGKKMHDYGNTCETAGKGQDLLTTEGQRGMSGRSYVQQELDP